MSSEDKGRINKLTAFLLTIAVAAITAWFVTREMRSHQDNSFSNTSLQTRFMSYATTLSPIRRLQVAQLKQIEVFEQKSEASLFWNRLQLPDVVVRATAPVEYQYYFDLNDRWEFIRKDDVIIVKPPNLKASPPSVDISNLNFEIRKGSIFRNEREVALGLQKQLTPLLEKRALENSNLVKETARKELGAILQTWLGPDNKLKIEVILNSDGPTSNTNQ